MCEGAIYQAGIKKVYFGSYSQSLISFIIKEKKIHNEKNGYLFYGGV